MDYGCYREVAGSIPARGKVLFWLFSPHIIWGVMTYLTYVKKVKPFHQLGNI